MDSFLAPLVAFLLLYKYWALFLILCSSSIVVPWPTNSLMLAAGAFASQGVFSFWVSVVVAVAGNVTGDLFNFVLARRYGNSALRMLKVKPPAYFERLERYVQSHAGTTIFFTRFVGTAGALTSLLAGLSGVSTATFLFYSIIGNLASDGAVIYAGYFFGENWRDVIDTFSLLGWIVLAVLVLLALSGAAWYRRSSKGSKNS